MPSCNFLKEDILAAYANLQMTESSKVLLAGIAETIIPAGTIKGAADIAVEDFILVMVNDCLKPENQKSFTQGLNGFKEYTESGWKAL
ncbi:MAG: gluconate 2-dehydrogenase subunit 3 family protein [Cytophagales bacterium]|nr:gluconate 2-dehydrogenase subunit 3 family protein [Cytophagales bacterium]